jgi:hypothetical protein
VCETPDGHADDERPAAGFQQDVDGGRLESGWAAGGERERHRSHADRCGEATDDDATVAVAVHRGATDGSESEEAEVDLLRELEAAHLVREEQTAEREGDETHAAEDLHTPGPAEYRDHNHPPTVTKITPSGRAGP